MAFKVEYLEEPSLMFGNDGIALDPRIGLVKYGPRTPTGEPHHISMKIGLIGDLSSITEIQRFFKLMRNRILPEINLLQKWKMPFPGLGVDSPLNMSINVQKRWRQIFFPDEIGKFLKYTDKNQMIVDFIQYVESKIDIIYGKESPPDVIIICIPESIYRKCVSQYALKEKIQTQESDFHNLIKVNSIIRKIPTQLIHPNTIKQKATQDMSDIAWNLTVGLLYKSQKGHPWKLTELEENTCYAGISFYIERGTNLTKAAMAQVFLDTGESFILRADRINEIKGRRKTHLSYEDSVNVTNQIIKQYMDVRGHPPQRLVIHKSSNFWDEEREGISNAASKIPLLDLITIREINPIRLLSSGQYPVLRGTLLIPPDRYEYYLYTTGYNPTLATYQGHRIPKPLVVKPDLNYCSSSIYSICKEILAFTKLDWNSSHFSKKMPVTLEISRSVGQILAEVKARKIEKIDPHYYYYM